jgi:flagellar biosynthesis/type III secretory pathway protein FliH
MPRASGLSALNVTPFQTMAMEGSLTEEELAQRLAQAKAEGYREAEARMITPVNAALENIERVLDELSHFRRELFKESEEDIIELIRGISKRICLKESSVTPDLMKDIVAKAISILERQKKVSLQINSADFEFYTRAKPDFIQRFKGLEELDITVSPDVPQGSVGVRSKTLELDVRLEAMVDHLLEQVRSAKVEVNQVNDEGDSI